MINDWSAPIRDDGKMRDVIFKLKCKMSLIHTVGFSPVLWCPADPKTVLTVYGEIDTKTVETVLVFKIGFDPANAAV